MGTLNELQRNREQRFATLDANARARKAQEDESARYKRLYESSRAKNERLREELDALREENGVLRVKLDEVVSITPVENADEDSLGEWAVDTDESDLGGD